ncbi:hypothetical protein [Streptomyces resistomycificus]|uniref:Uncharacterized protein n=1 Tax=Streptomyces resistomycificus TaxID=67356 RepID=A0A0L8LFS8_9ACTN|nr:hypothetical protein [Streptomyces resistomycificus]KOG36964.1 hypothetical protein ADK37_13205 [Streptomyces resistomycificus]KUN96583.1 hypothetical protein AQJ84_19645 [Streptomyces resistomycificus]
MSDATKDPVATPDNTHVTDEPAGEEIKPLNTHVTSSPIKPLNTHVTEVDEGGTETTPDNTHVTSDPN